MEKLTINIPESKSADIKQFLKAMGVVVQGEKPFDADSYRKKLSGIGTWSEDDLKAIEEARTAFNSLKPQEW